MLDGPAVSSLAAPCNGVPRTKRWSGPSDLCPQRPFHRSGVQIGASNGCPLVSPAGSHSPNTTFCLASVDRALYAVRVLDNLAGQMQTLASIFPIRYIL